LARWRQPGGEGHRELLLGAADVGMVCSSGATRCLLSSGYVKIAIENDH